MQRALSIDHEVYVRTAFDADISGILSGVDPSTLYVFMYQQVLSVVKGFMFVIC